ncbi:hypothetical protein VNO80_28002 [Phaseolus coccineus]|uniref:Uncharacterized protein n=1 Tax=Phaseolus coccineus TaxID=3886 RepID=A0AAN9LKL2_PHACN
METKLSPATHVYSWSSIIVQSNERENNLDREGVRRERNFGLFCVPMVQLGTRREEKRNFISFLDGSL